MDVVNVDTFKNLLGGEYWWVVEVFLTVLITLVVALIVNRILIKLHNRTRLSKNMWDDSLFESLLRPAKWMVWLFGLLFAAELAGANTDSNFFEILPVVRKVASIVIFTWFLVTFIGRVEHHLVNPKDQKSPMDPTTAAAVGKLIRAAIIITSTLVGVQSLGYSISGVLAFGGIGGIAVGFAAKDLLANFFGGLMIYLDRPFSVGDWIRSADQEIEGTVEDIGWRLTRIRTFDKRPLYVPNATFAQISVENPSRMTNRRIYETIGIRYDDVGKMNEIVAAVKDMIDNHPELDTSQTVIVNFNKFASCSLDFFVYCFTKTTNWVEYHEIKQDVLLRIIGIIEGFDAQCAFPTSTVHIPNAISVDEGVSKS